jgi:hypothetical protein
MYGEVKLKLHTFSTSAPPEVRNQIHDPVAFSKERSKRYAIDRTLGELQNYFGRIFERKISASAENRTPDDNMP